MDKQDIKKEVRERYARVVTQDKSCACSDASTAKASSCCGPSNLITAEQLSKSVGYADADMNSVPEGANLGLGCGNPVALASLKEGEVVLDLGSGAGFDCFLASQKVGPKGKVIGVDMTPEMIDRARENVRKGNYKNVEFRLGEIENLPVADNSVDIIISNCVINLSEDKPRVFREAFRALKPSGRLMVSDIVLLADLPGPVLESIEAYVGCVAGASKKADYLKAIRDAGFTEVSVVDQTVFPTDALASDPTVQAVVASSQLSAAEVAKIAASIVSVKVSALKK
jgi:arsenite methyltransferase